MIQYDQWYFVSSIPLFCEFMHVCYAYLESSTQTISILLDFYLFCNPMMSLKRIFLQTRNWNIFTLNLKYIYIHIYTWWICWERIILYIYIYIYIIVSQQIHRVDAIDRENLLMRHPKQNNIETLTLILTYHPALKNVHEILRKAHRHTLKSPRLQYVLPTPPRVAFRNDKSLKDKLVRSKLKNPNRIDPANYKCTSNLCQICNINSLENEFTDRHRSKI